MTPSHDRRYLVRFAALSLLAAVTTILLKLAAYWLTGSVGLLADALESVVNVAAAAIALWVLVVAARPPDEGHAYGHDKAELLSSAVEGVLIVGAALLISVTTIERLREPQAIEHAAVGLAVSAAAAAINLVTAVVLIRTGRRERSAALEGNGLHLLTDVWTSVGVIVGVGLVAITGFERLDPLIALVVAANIVVAGVRLVHRSADGLLDAALSPTEQGAITAILDRYCASDGVTYHALMTRQGGARRFASVHVLVPGDWTVARGHDLLERIEADLRDALPGLVVFTHLEPAEHPASFADRSLDRPPGDADAGPGLPR